jgi:ABC-type iron transport system FetAB permease component
MFDRGVVHIVVVGYIVDHYCFRFDRGVVHIVVAVILLTITVCGLTEE